MTRFAERTLSCFAAASFLVLSSAAIARADDPEPPFGGAGPAAVAPEISGECLDVILPPNDSGSCIETPDRNFPNQSGNAGCNEASHHADDCYNAPDGVHFICCPNQDGGPDDVPVEPELPAPDDGGECMDVIVPATSGGSCFETPDRNFPSQGSAGCNGASHYADDCYYGDGGELHFVCCPLEGSVMGGGSGAMGGMGFGF